MVSDGLDFIFFFSVDDVWGWSREIGSVLFRLLIRGKQPGVEDIMHCPRGWEVQLIGDRGNDPRDFERSVSFRG